MNLFYYNFTKSEFLSIDFLCLKIYKKLYWFLLLNNFFFFFRIPSGSGIRSGSVLWPRLPRISGGTPGRLSGSRYRTPLPSAPPRRCTPAGPPQLACPAPPVIIYLGIIAPKTKIIWRISVQSFCKVFNFKQMSPASL